MQVKTLHRLGLFGGAAVMVLASSQFLKTYRAGDANWLYLIMVCGMGIILYSTIFKKRTE